MAFKEYTKCVKPGDFVDFGGNPVGISHIILLLLTAGFIAFAVIAIAGGPVAITIAIALVSAVIIFLRWWLFGRLICLGDPPENCAIIGMVLSHGPSDPSMGGKWGDNDYTMNVLLAPGPLNILKPPPPPDLGQIKADYWAPPQGDLVAENAAILGIGRGYVQEGKNLKYLQALHCEFEGDGIRSILDAAYGVLAMLLLALVIPGSWIVGVIIALLVLFRKIFLADPGDPGSGNPLDIGPSPGSLDGRAVVVVKGEWIYDSLHGGWNEIHPVRDCQVIGHLKPDEGWPDFKYTDPDTGTVFTLDLDANVKRFRDFWCGALKDAKDAEDGGSHDNPEHDWGIHPGIDGCKKPIIIF
jgi:hypothetical protein